MASTKLLSTSQRMDLAAAATLLTTIAEKLKTGEIVLSSGADSLNLTVPDQVEVDVEVTSAAKRAGTKMELEIEISWYEGQAPGAGTLTIGG